MLLSTPGKALNRVLLERMKEAVDPNLRDQQAGFQNRFCADQIASLRIIVEQSLEWNSPLYINFSFSFSSVSVSAQDGIVALGKAHTRSAPSLSSLPKVALETVPIFVWLNTDRSRPWRVECRPLPFSTPLSFRRSML